MVVGLESFQVPGALVVLELPVLALQGFRGQFLYFQGSWRSGQGWAQESVHPVVGPLAISKEAACSARVPRWILLSGGPLPSFSLGWRLVLLRPVFTATSSLP